MSEVIERLRDSILETERAYASGEGEFEDVLAVWLVYRDAILESEERFGLEAEVLQVFDRPDVAYHWVLTKVDRRSYALGRPSTDRMLFGGSLQSMINGISRYYGNRNKLYREFLGLGLTMGNLGSVRGY